jgi:hypothetical protein
MGHLYRYRPKLKSGERSSVWWAKYYVNGRPEAEAWLRRQLEGLGREGS